MRRKLAFIVPCCFALAMGAPAARANTIEQVKATANGVVPASVTITVSDPRIEDGLLKVCVTSNTFGRLFCIAI
jgi:hypothetical protein